MWRGLAAPGGRADARAPARGVSEEAGLAEGRAACPPHRPLPHGRRLCVRACAWGAPRRRAGERRRQAQPPVAEPGAAPRRAGTAALPPPPRAGVIPGPRRALPRRSRLGAPSAQTPLLPGSRSRLRGGRGNECGGGGARAGLEERESGRGSGPGAELRRPQTRLPAVRRALHLCHAQPRQVLQAALVLSPGMVSL